MPASIQSDSTRGRAGKALGGGVVALLAGLMLPALAHPPAKGDVLAEVDGEPITAEEVEKSIGAPLARLEQQIHALKRQRIVTMIDERLVAKLAAKRGVSIPALLDTEVAGKVEPITEQELDSVYSARKGQFQGDERSRREQVKAQLRDQKLAERKRAFLESLRSQARLVQHLQPPPVFVAEVSTEGSPFKGGAAAPVTVVEFQDFHCPFCERVQPALTQLLSRYGDRIKLVYRDFPIDQLHPQARKAHEAARCANDQGKFWSYHDVLFAKPKKAGPEDLKAYAQEAGLEPESFERCLAARTHQAAVQKDIDDGIRAGVTGTPAFFINGRMLSGAMPVENFARVVDEELARAR